MALLFIGTTEIILIALVVLLLFGGRKIPELMRGMGKGVKSFKDGMNGKDEEEIKEDLRYLQLLAQSYPNVAEASCEIINLEAILNLPKPTEHFISDPHGESDAFNHVLRNASGYVKRKVEEIFGPTLRLSEKQELCTLIYYPEAKLQRIKAAETNFFRMLR